MTGKFHHDRYRDELERRINDYQRRIELLTIPQVETIDGESQTENRSEIEHLKRTIIDKEEERNLIRERLNEVELELKKIRDENVKLVEEKSSLIDQHLIQTATR